MNICDFLTTQRNNLQKLEAAANGLQHDLGPGNVVELLAALINALDKDQERVDELGQAEESTRTALFLGKRAEQIAEVRRLIVQALDAAANKELTI